MLIALGMNITRAPIKLYDKLSLVIPTITDLKIVPTVVRQYFREMKNWTKHKELLKDNLIGVASFLLLDVEESSEVDGLPCLLDANNDLTIVNLLKPLYTCDFLNLLPKHYNRHFVSPFFLKSGKSKDQRLLQEYIKLKIVIPLDVKFVAEHIELPTVPAIFVKYEELVTLLWKFLLCSDHFKTVDALGILNEISLIPASNGVLYSPKEGKHLLSDYNVIKLLQNLRLPILEYKSLLGTKEIHDRIGILKETLKPYLANPDVPEQVLTVLDSHRLPDNYTNTAADATSFITFVQSCEDFHSHLSTLRKLKLHLTIKYGELVSQETPNMFYIECEQLPKHGLALAQLHNSGSITLCRFLTECKPFYKKVGITALSMEELYKQIIFPYGFAENMFMCEDKIDYLKYLYNDHFQIFSNSKSLLSLLHFIPKTGCTNSLFTPNDFFDPQNEFLNTFLPNEKFPPQIWAKGDILKILRLIGLRTTVDNDDWIELAVKTSQAPVEAKKCKFLLKSLNERINGALLSTNDNDWAALLSLLSKICKIPFVPVCYPEDYNEIFRALGFKLDLTTKPKYVAFSKSVTCDNGNALLSSLCEAVIVSSREFIPHGLQKNAQLLTEVYTALNIKTPSLQSVMSNLLSLINAVSECFLPYEATTTNALKQLEKLFSVHYSWLSKNAKNRSDVDQLSNIPCLYVPSEDFVDFKMMHGRNFVQHAQVEKAYSHLLSPLPRYLRGPEFRAFLENIGVEENINALHYIELLMSLRDVDMCNPNCYNAVVAAYHDFVTLLRNKESECVMVESYINTGNCIFLPSDKGLLVNSKHLILNDDPWIKSRLQNKSIEIVYAMMPPPLSTGELGLPSCLKIPKLSNLVIEELDRSVLNDPYNDCPNEAFAKLRKRALGCSLLLTFRNLIRSEEFATGLLRVMSHKLNGEPLGEEHKSVVQCIQQLEICCVRKIETQLTFRGSKISGGTKMCHLDDDKSKLHVVFHQKPNSKSEDLLTSVVKEVSKLTGNLVNDFHLQAIIKCTYPDEISTALNNLQIAIYVPNVTKGFFKLDAALKDDIDMLIMGNYRPNEEVLYCAENGKMQLAKVEKVIHSTNIPPFPPTIELSLTDSVNVVSSEMNSLLICKFLSKEQKRHLTSLIYQQTCIISTKELEKVIILSIPLSENQFKSYFSTVLSTIHNLDNLQKRFVIERLIFQLYFICQSKFNEEGTRSFKLLSEILLKAFKEREGDEQSLKAISTMRERLLPSSPVLSNLPQAICQPGSSSSSVFPSIHHDRPLMPNYVCHSGASVSRQSTSVPSAARAWWSPNWSSPLISQKKEPQLDKESAKMYLVQASSELNLIAHLLKSDTNCSFSYVVCFYSHEIIEKGLKAIFLAICGLENELSSSRNIVELLQKLTVHANCPNEMKDQNIRDNVLQVSRHGSCCRFPQENLPPVLTHTAQMAKSIHFAAFNILKVISRINCFKEYFKLPDNPLVVNAAMPKYFGDGGRLIYEIFSYTVCLGVCTKYIYIRIYTIPLPIILM